MPTTDEIAEAMQILGFDPSQVRTVIVTPDTVVAIAADYPEPLTAPEEDTDAH